MAKAKPTTQQYLCCVCNKPIVAARVHALKLLGKPEQIWTCVAHSTEKKVNGIYMGEAGTSELRIVDKVYQDSVHDVFRKTAAEADSDSDSD